MKYILLCGGSGKRLQSSSCFPKPLNHVFGVHSVQYVIESIPSDEIYVIANKDLPDFSFQDILQQITKKTLHFVYLDRYTRGPVETAYLGLKQMNLSPDEPVCFFDNDTVYKINTQLPSTSFIGYSKITTQQKHPYCFLDIQNTMLQQITEKVQISNDYACGIYGFATINLFLEKARQIIMNNFTYNNEFYMSLLYDVLLKESHPVHCVEISSICMGTPEDLQKNYTTIPQKRLRICFDLDNTLVQYKHAGQKYSDLKPIEKNVFLLRSLKNAGHTIILYTARGMKTNQQNLGKSMASVAKETFDNLEKNNIPYDEIYFGKPDADLYIDDKAFNPYAHNFFESIGFGHLEKEYLNESNNVSSGSNKFNIIYRKGNHIYKQGPVSSMTGEVYFYKQVQNTAIANYFPRYYDDSQTSNSHTLHLEYIEGITLFELLKDELLTPYHLRLVFDSLDTIHKYPGIKVTIDKKEIYENYMGKLKKRSLNTNDYPFSNTQEILTKIDVVMKEYIFQDTFSPCNVVHGDPWFSNTILTRSNSIIYLDMKGDINGTLTTNGDELTDYGKIYQSLLGFDAILNNVDINEKYMNDLRNAFLAELKEKGISMRYFNAVTACLIGKTLSFLSVDLAVREKIWGLVVSLTNSLN